MTIRRGALATLAFGLLAIGCSSESRPAGEHRAASKSVDTNVTNPVSDSYLDQAIDLYRRSEHDSVRAMLEPALAKARAEADSVAEAKILTVLGLTAYRLSDYVESRRLQERALDLKLKLGLEDELADSYNGLGLIAWRTSRPSDAAELLDRASEALERKEARGATDLDDRRAFASVSINRGLAHTDLGNFSQAREAFELGHRVGREIGNARAEGMALNNLGMLSVWIGEPVEAIAQLNLARSLYRSVDFVDGELNALGQMGTAYRDMGDLGRAIAILDSAVSLARERDIKHEEASNLEQLAQAHGTAGDYRRALELYAEAESLNAEIGLVEETGSDQRLRAEIYIELGEPEMAQDFAERALATHREVGARWEELSDLLLLAELSNRLGDAATQRSYLGAAQTVASGTEARTARMAVALTEARIADRGSQSKRVIGVLGAVEEDLAKGGYDTEWEAELLLARAYLRLAQLEAADTHSGRAVAAVERVRTNFASDILRSAYTTNHQEAYAVRVAALLARGERAAAFEAADAARASAFFEHLSIAQTSEDAGGATAALRERERLIRRINELTETLQETEYYLAGDDPDGEIDDLTDRLHRARAEYEAFHIRTAELEGRAIVSGSATATLSAIREVLRDREILIQYLVAPDRLFGFAVTADTLVDFSVDVAVDDLQRQVRVASVLLGDPNTDSEEARPAFSALRQLLLEPVGDLIEKSERVIFVPHLALNHVPFAALPDAAGRYLAQRHSVQLVPSAAILPTVRAAPDGPSERRVQHVSFSPLSKALPATRAEARAFARTVSGAKAVNGRRATEERLREALAGRGFVHVATHAVLNPQNPMFSRIEMAGELSDRSNNDGRLEVHEVFDLSIRSPLVFLSGCETGLGTAGFTEFARGDDYATLARAFLFAGARNVIATLWRIEDEGAAEFARRFYEALETVEPAEALARAQRGMMSHAHYSKPYYWAGYGLSGAGLLARGR